MSRSIYLINPRADFPTYYGAEVFKGRGYRPAVLLADLVLPTLAAMVPDDFDVRLCDEHLEPVDFAADVDYVGITGKVSQWGRMQAIAEEFRRRGRTVIIGGPHASLSPDVVRPHCDLLVRDEIEEIAPALFDDLRHGTWQEEYVGGRPELSTSPVPRWDLYERYNDRVLTATLQTARGCPFECEFCDVIQYLGRRQRHKPIHQIIDELDLLYAHGYRSVLFADDNTTASRHWVGEMLDAVRDWNRGRDDGPVSFSTQLSIDAARDDDLLRLCAEAGMKHVFIGIETPNEESLVESRKHQNRQKNLRNTVDADPTLTDQIDRFLAHGISVTGGIICGFDHDGPDIFQRQYEFATETSLPILTVGALVAPAATPLNARLEAEGRLVSGPEVPGYAWDTNIRPKLMSHDDLRAGIRWLVNRLYRPENFGQRILAHMDRLATPDGVRHEPSTFRSVDADTLSLIGDIKKLDAASARMWDAVMEKLPTRHGLAQSLMEALVRYQQVRYMFDSGGFWDEESPSGAPELATTG